MTRNKCLSGACLTFVVFIFFTGFGCTKKAEEVVGFGDFEGSRYHNDYFKLTVDFPPDWSIQDNEAKKQLTDSGQKVLAGEDKNLEAAFQTAELTTVHMFTVMEHPLGTPVPFNVSISGVAEKVSNMPGIKRGSDYHFHARRLLEAGKLRFSFPKEIYTVSLSGMDFDVMTTKLPLGDLDITQEYYAKIIKGYALLFVLSYTTDEEKARLFNILENMTISKT